MSVDHFTVFAPLLAGAEYFLSPASSKYLTFRALKGRMAGKGAAAARFEVWQSCRRGV
jgi:hypothetical protein